MQNKLFDPELYKGKAVLSFKKCPGVLSLGWHVTEREDTKIICIDCEDVKHSLYVPFHGVIVQCVGIDGRVYVFTKVRSMLKFWLVTDYLKMNGYLFPIDTFIEKERDLQLEEETALA